MIEVSIEIFTFIAINKIIFDLQKAFYCEHISQNGNGSPESVSDYNKFNREALECSQ